MDASVTKMIGAPSAADLRRAREEFSFLLSQPTQEAIWQRFFAENRFVLSRSLPVKALPCDIVPLGRPGRSEPDFILHPGSPESENLHGIIELKTNTSRIVTQPRRNVLTLSRDADTAVRQLLKYDESFNQFSPRPRVLSFETLSYLFVIIGNARDLIGVEKSLIGDLRGLVPAGVRFLGFDQLFESYSRTVPKPLILLRSEYEFQTLPFLSLKPPIFNSDGIRVHRQAGVFAIVHQKPGYQESYVSSMQDLYKYAKLKIDRAQLSPYFLINYQIAGMQGAFDANTAILQFQEDIPKIYSWEFERTRYFIYNFDFSGVTADVCDPDIINYMLYPDKFEHSRETIEFNRMIKGLDGLTYRHPKGFSNNIFILKRSAIGRVHSLSPAFARGST